MSSVGCVLPSGAYKQIKRVIIEDLDDLQKLVGGNIEPLTVELEDGFFLTMFVNEDGHEKNLDMNWIASALFMREIVGDVVLIRVTPTGEDSGEFADLPSQFITWLENKHMPKVADAYNQTLMVSAMFRLAVTENLISEEEVEEFFNETMQYLDGEEITPEVHKRTTDFINRVIAVVEEKVTNGLGDTLADEIYEFLDKGGK
jgi:hypothetical protein